MKTQNIFVSGGIHASDLPFHLTPPLFSADLVTTSPEGSDPEKWVDSGGVRSGEIDGFRRGQIRGNGWIELIGGDYISGGVRSGEMDGFRRGQIRGNGWIELIGGDYPALIWKIYQKISACGAL